jgi:hypothetical protein
MLGLRTSRAALTHQSSLVVGTTPVLLHQLTRLQVQALQE